MDANYLIWLLCFNQSECSILMRIYMDNYIKIFCLYLATMHKSHIMTSGTMYSGYGCQKWICWDINKVVNLHHAVKQIIS